MVGKIKAQKYSSHLKEAIH